MGKNGVFWAQMCYNARLMGTKGLDRTNLEKLQAPEVVRVTKNQPTNVNIEDTMLGLSPFEDLASQGSLAYAYAA